jgi:hypothetical protein
MRIALLLACLCLSGCPATRPVEGPVALFPLAAEIYSGVREARREVLRDADSWQKLWDQTQNARRIAPPVDFERQMVLFVALGERRTGGYAIEIVRAEVVEGTLVVHVKETAPKPGAIATMALTAPLHAVAVPRSELPVRWFKLP